MAPQKMKGNSGLILDHHQHPVALMQAKIQQGIAGPVHAFCQRGIGRVAIHSPNGDLISAPLAEMPVDERHGDVETLCEGERRRTGCRVNGDGIGVHRDFPVTPGLPLQPQHAYCSARLRVPGVFVHPNPLIFDKSTSRDTEFR